MPSVAPSDAEHTEVASEHTEVASDGEFEALVNMYMDSEKEKTQQSSTQPKDVGMLRCQTKAFSSCNQSAVFESS